MIRKLMITPWFGEQPPWMDRYLLNIESHLRPQGYDFLFQSDVDWFKKRVKYALSIDCPIEEGSSKIHDYRAAFGVIFFDEIKGYDFWGHTDFDCVYGRVQEFVSDDFLDSLDIYSNHWDYICGPWTLYRNTAFVNSLFMDQTGWQSILENPTTSGWVEKEFTRVVDHNSEAGTIRRIYKLQHVYEDFSKLHFEGDRLMDDTKEVMMAHFRRSKEYPVGCL